MNYEKTSTRWSKSNKWEKRFQAFISSTYVDLKEENEVIRAFLELDSRI